MGAFVTQAETYYRAAGAVRDASSALLYYYAFLNLAKAELLQTHAAKVHGEDPHHGLTYRPKASETVRGDKIRTRDGVFPMLYEKRTGNALASGLILPVLRLLRNCPEVQWELEFSSIDSSHVAELRHAVVAAVDGLRSFLVVMPIRAGALQATEQALRAEYTRVTPIRNWRTLFEVRGEVPQYQVMFFQSRWKNSGVSQGGGSASSAAVAEVADRAWSTLRPFLTVATVGQAHHYYFAPSMYASRTLAMRPDLSRYALMFYISSIARYRPSRIDVSATGQDRWLLGAFTRQAAIPLLHASAMGLTGGTLTFDPRGAG